jgi:hypothetical protein
MIISIDIGLPEGVTPEEMTEYLRPLINAKTGHNDGNGWRATVPLSALDMEHALRAICQSAEEILKGIC